MAVFDPFDVQQETPQAPQQEQSTFDKYLGIGSPAQRFVAGAVNEPLMALGQVVIDPFANVMGYGKPVTEYAQRIAKLEEEGRAARGDTGFDVYKTAGAVASPATYIPAAKAAQVAGTGLRGGMLSGLATSQVAAPTLNEDIAAGKYEQGLPGLLLGGAFGKGTEMLGRVVSPRITNEEKIIRDMGIQPTTGESLGGIFRKAEEFASRIPGLDIFVKPAREESVKSFNTGLYNRVLGNLKGIVGKEEEKIASGVLGTDAISAMDETISKAYDTILPKMGYRLNTNVYNDINTVVSGLNDDQQKVVSKFLQDRFGDKLKKSAGSLSGDDIKVFEADIRKKINTYSGSGKSGADIEIGDALKEIRNIFRDDLYTQNPKFVPSLRKVDRAYAEAEVLRDAVTRAATDKAGVFTPHDLGMAVKATAGTAGNKTFSRGEALLQQESQAASKVFGGADRGTSAIGALGAGYAAAGNLPVAIASAGGLGILYSKYGQKFVDTLMTKRPDMAQKIGKAIQSAGTITPAIAAQIERINKEEQITPQSQVFDPFNQQSFNQPQSTNDLKGLVSATIQQKQVPPELARMIPALVKYESSWNPTAKNPDPKSSAKGLFQMTNAARADVGIPRNATVRQDIEGGIDYLMKMYRKYGDVNKAIQAYNQGHYNPKSKEGKQYVAAVYRNL